MKTNPNDPIYHSNIVSVDMQGKARGNALTKRELFAAMAMQGLLSDNDYSPYTLRNGDYINTLGEQCVKYADALIAELNKEVQS